MEKIEGGFSWSDFFSGACQGFTAVAVLASPVGIIKVLVGGATIGCLSLS
jgi:hypothetical protein